MLSLLIARGDVRHLVGDKNTFLVNTTGWVAWEDVFPEYVLKHIDLSRRSTLHLLCSNQHPNVPGHQKIAGLFERWLGEWGLQPEVQ